MRLPRFITTALFRALTATVALKRPRDVAIGGDENPYMLRWWVIPRNKWFNVYLHHFLRPDDDRALHDHPWWNLSLLLKGHYWEILPCNPDKPLGPSYSTMRTAGAMVFRRPEAAHRIDLDVDYAAAVSAGRDVYRSCWTLFITGPRIRDWGFWCPQGWRPWTKFVDMKNPGKVGPGCGD